MASWDGEAQLDEFLYFGERLRRLLPLFFFLEDVVDLKVSKACFEQIVSQTGAMTMLCCESKFFLADWTLPPSAVLRVFSSA
ncbi:hypothetical protein NDU88_001417 [Pleurodeles waltl]|uniref:Uncharacterized protein n=1 Tax=Pleurodeles waltl TaxID=8319 RepID=A0AAV7NF27_PLEWA|nr:hypothetical protein NDU88_001417 [Pleurodeles waltl]